MRAIKRWGNRFDRPNRISEFFQKQQYERENLVFKNLGHTGIHWVNTGPYWGRSGGTERPGSILEDR